MYGWKKIPLNKKRTWEMVVRGNVFRPPPDPIPTIERRTLAKDFRSNITGQPMQLGLALRRTD